MGGKGNCILSQLVSKGREVSFLMPPNGSANFEHWNYISPLTFKGFRSCVQWGDWLSLISLLCPTWDLLLVLHICNVWFNCTQFLCASGFFSLWTLLFGPILGFLLAGPGFLVLVGVTNPVHIFVIVTADTTQYESESYFGLSFINIPHIILPCATGDSDLTTPLWKLTFETQLDVKLHSI